MAIRRPFKIVLWSVFAVASVWVLSVFYSVWQYQLSVRDYESSKAAGLSATPPPEVGFDTVSAWAQGPISKIISGIVGPPAQGGAGGILIAPLEVPGLRSERSSDGQGLNTEAYNSISDNPFVAVDADPLSTFSIDVDTASYANMRRFITKGEQPPKDSLRIEEMINYFTYDYPQPTGKHPINVVTEVAAAPWQPEHRLVRIGLKTRDLDLSRRPAGNFVFLIDVSGSMDEPTKLPLLKNSMKLLVDSLSAADRIAIVVYAGQEGLALPSTTGDRKSVVLDSIDRLEPGGSTNGAAGIQLAYALAASTFIGRGINRVILATDGDFNVGVTSDGDLVRLIQEKAKTGVFLSVLGFGEGNLKDSKLEKLADEGNGNYAYIDTLNEARKVLVHEMGGTLATVAKDVKIQVEFNPAEVRARRLIGYENRVLRHEDFNNDAKDAGDMGAGHTVTALFEVVPNGVEFAAASADPLRYQNPPVPRGGGAGELLNLKIRYKEPDGAVSQVLEVPVFDSRRPFREATSDFQFAAAVAAFGMVLRDSPHKGQATLEEAINIAEQNRGKDNAGYRDEFIRLARTALWR